jgi:hypothetical protein
MYTMIIRENCTLGQFDAFDSSVLTFVYLYRICNFTDYIVYSVPLPGLLILVHPLMWSIMLLYS